MSETLDIESDAFLKLLTDALRSGPGSPEWRQAVAQLRTKNGDADEYRMLCAAREHLESGKAYREVRAGPGFTKKVLDQVDQENAGGITGSISTANTVAIIAAIAILVILGVIGYFLFPTEGKRTAIDDLARTYFGNTVVYTTFDGPVPSEWRRIGPVTLDSDSGLRPATSHQPSETHRGGGIVALAPIPSDQPFAVELTLDVPEVSDKVVAQLFVTDQPTYSEDRATTPHELVWYLEGDRVSVVLPNGRVGSSEQRIKPSAQPLTVRLVMNRDYAMIDSAGTQLWAGENQLAPDKPRYVGIRFLTKAGDKLPPISVQSARIQKTQSGR
jgi:hypothetical protein